MIVESNDNLEEEYLKHKIFIDLKRYSGFYNDLSYSVICFISSGTESIINLDTYSYKSIKGTINSISEILKKGRINDAYALLRKYFDSTLINVYTNLFLRDHFTQENLIVQQIDDWVKGKETIPEIRIISRYIKESEKLKPINDLLNKDDRYKRIRKKCNDNTHYNFYENFLLNCTDIYNPHRIEHLNMFSFFIESLFIQHFAYIFYLQDYYLSSTDYIDSLELGYPTENEFKYLVAPFIQKVFTEIIEKKRPDIAKEIKNKTSMNLE